VTISARPRHAYVEVIELDDTVTFHRPEDLATRDLSNYRPGFTGARRPPLDDTAEQPAYEVPRTIGVVDRSPVVDELQQRFDRFYGATRTADPAYTSRHRAPGPFTRLLLWIGGRR
jgi:hypothetical protein